MIEGFLRSVLLACLALVSPLLAASQVEGEVRFVRVAAVQFDAKPEAPGVNLKAMERLTRRGVQLGAKIVLFHENSLVDYGDDLALLAQRVPTGTACKRMRDLAEELDCYVGFGMVEEDGGRYYDTHVFVGPDRYVQSYRKTWLFQNLTDPRRDEWSHFDPGEGPKTFLLDGIRVGVLICSDAQSGRAVKRMYDLEPELVFFPNNRSNLPEPSYFSGLARTLRAPIVLANRCGQSWQYACNGGSCVLDSGGRVVAAANRNGKEEVLIADVPIPPR